MNTDKQGQLGGGGLTRRTVLAAGGALGVAGLAGCVEELTGMIGDEAAKRAVTTRSAAPAATWGGDGLPDGGIAESDRRDQYVPLSVSGDVEGVSGTVELDGWGVTSTLRANNHNTTRSNRITPSLGPGGGGDIDGDGLEDLLDYLDGEAIIGERFAAVVPDARLRQGDASLAAEMTPDRVLEYLLRDPGTEATDSEGRTFRWPDAPRLSAAITLPAGGGSQSDEYDPTAQLLALGYKGDVNNATGILRRSSIDPDDDDDGILSDDEWVYVADANARGSGGGPLREWGEERSAGEADVSPLIVRSIWAQPPDCPRAMPALLYVRRVRHDEQLLFVGGWVIDDHALYHDAVTVLTAEGLPQVVGVDVRQDNPDAMRRQAREGIEGERARLGSVCYDGVLGEGAMPFLPETHRSGGGARIFYDSVRAAVGRRNPQTGKEIQIAAKSSVDVPDEEAVKSLLVPVDPPIVHLRASEQCPCKDCCKILPAAPNIPSR